MAEPPQLDRWVEHLGAAAKAGFQAQLPGQGPVEAPVVHILCAGLDPPYLGYVACAPRDQGVDAAAVAALGLLPAAVRASRLVVCWEHANLNAALESPGPADQCPAALMVLDARPRNHVLARHELRMPPGPAAAREAATVEPTWGPVSAERNAPLPKPVHRLLAVWRDGGGDGSAAEAVRVCTALEQAGYRMRWASRRVHESAPAWARALAALVPQV